MILPIDPMEEHKDASRHRSALLRFWWAWLFLIGLFGLFAYGLVTNSIGRPQVGEVAPAFSLEMLNGYSLDSETTLTSADLEGRVVIINFWASWCIECTYEADDLQAIWEKYPSDEVVMLGIAYLDEEAESLDFLSQFGITYPNGFDRGSTISEETFFLTGVPETFIIDQDGNVAQIYIGPVEEAALTEVVDQLLAGNS